MGRAAEDHWELVEPEPSRGPTSGSTRLRRIERLSWFLDRSLVIGRWKVGFDPIIGLLPGVGDTIGTLLSLYVLYEAARLGIRTPVLMRMLGNIALEAFVGAIPLLGDIFDFVWQANTRNIALVHRHYQPGLKSRSVGWIGGVIALLAIAILLLIATAAYFLVRAIMAAWAAFNAG
jgi:hypothetical protein